MNLENYIAEIARYKELAKELPDDVPAALQRKIDLYVAVHYLLGYVAGEYSTLSHTLHVERKRLYWDAYEAAPKPKAMYADRAVYAIEMSEAEASGLYRKYQNEVESTREIIHALKAKQRVSIADGSFVR